MEIGAGDVGYFAKYIGLVRLQISGQISVLFVIFVSLFTVSSTISTEVLNTLTLK